METNIIAVAHSLLRLTFWCTIQSSLSCYYLHCNWNRKSLKHRQKFLSDWLEWIFLKRLWFLLNWFPYGYQQFQDVPQQMYNHALNLLLIVFGSALCSAFSLHQVQSRKVTLLVGCESQDTRHRADFYDKPGKMWCAVLSVFSFT